MKLTGSQIEAAMALARITRESLCKEAGIAKKTLNDAINDKTAYREDTIKKIRGILESRGVEFTDNEGVRRRPPSVRTYEGVDAFSEFYDFLYETIKSKGGDVCICGSNAGQFAKYRRNPQIHRERMSALMRERTDIRVRTIIQEGDTNTFSSAYTTYRFLPKEYFSASSTTFYAFGEYYSLISFAHIPAPLVVCIHSKNMADDYRKSFNALWDHITLPNHEVGPSS